MKYNFHLIFCCLISCSSIFSQEAIIIKGEIKTDSINQSLINIVNLTQKTGTTNSASGDFEIRVKRQDTLIFSSVQYEIEKVIISPEIFQRGYLEIFLKEKLNELPEVHLSNIGLSGNLERDLATIKVFNQADHGFSFATKPPPSGVHRHISLASNSPVELLFNTLNGRLKMLKKAREMMRFDEMIDKGVDAVPQDFFIETLGIVEEEITNFVYFCAEQPIFRSLLSKDQHLALLEFYYHNAPLFLNQPKD